GASKSFGVRLPACSADAFDRVGDSIPKDLRPALSPLLRAARVLTKTIRDYDKKVESLCEREYPETQRLRQVDGVGALTSLAFVLAVGTPERFAKSRDVGAYLGMCPRRSQSGSIDPQLHTTKTGDGYLRRLLVSAAPY